MTARKLPTNPLPCGCRVYGIVDDAASLHVVHCPMHAAAGDVAAVLIDVKLWLVIGSVIYPRVCAAIDKTMGR